MLTVTKRPEWLNKIVRIKDCQSMQGIVEELGLNTVCQEANCPNISECFSNGEATFLILGRSCTRSCSFCGVDKTGLSAVDPKEPERVAKAVRRLNLRHVVITSVTRDDLDDGGAEVFARTISSIRERAAGACIEVLIPDFKGKRDSILKLVDACPCVVGHNLETVPRLYKEVRPQADYGISLKVLNMVKQLAGGKKIYTKSGLMLGLGETRQEVLGILADLREIDCDFLSIGQYLAPSARHLPVKEYLAPAEFDYYKREALKLGFSYVASGPYIRSSYLASEYIRRS